MFKTVELTNILRACWICQDSTNRVLHCCDVLKSCCSNSVWIDFSLFHHCVTWSPMAALLWVDDLWKKLFEWDTNATKATSSRGDWTVDKIWRVDIDAWVCLQGLWWRSWWLLISNSCYIQKIQLFEKINLNISTFKTFKTKFISLKKIKHGQDHQILLQQLHPILEAHPV